MADIINLNKARKEKAKLAAKARAAENKSLFGRTKHARSILEIELEKARRDLEGHKRED